MNVLVKLGKRGISRDKRADLEVEVGSAEVVAAVSRMDMEIKAMVTKGMAAIKEGSATKEDSVATIRSNRVPKLEGLYLSGVQTIPVVLEMLMNGGRY